MELHRAFKMVEEEIWKDLRLGKTGRMERLNRVRQSLKQKLLTTGFREEAYDNFGHACTLLRSREVGP